MTNPTTRTRWIAAVRAKACGKTLTDLTRKLEEARFWHRHISRTDIDYMGVKQAAAALAEWERLAGLVTESGAETYDPVVDPIVQREATEAAELQEAIDAEAARLAAIRTQAEEHRAVIDAITASLTTAELAHGERAVRAAASWLSGGRGGLTGRQAALIFRLARDRIAAPDTSATDVRTVAVGMTVRQVALRAEAARVAQQGEPYSRAWSVEEREMYTAAWQEWQRLHREMLDGRVDVYGAAGGAV